MIIREAQVGDAGGIANILNPIVEEGRFTVLDRVFTLEEEQAFIRDFPKRGVFNVAVLAQGPAIAGFQNVEPFASYTRVFDHVGIIATYVGSDYRRQGIAGRLFESTFRRAVSKAYEKLFAYVRADNERALATYLSQGFVVVGTAKKHAKIQGKYVDEILIEKFL